MASSCWLGIKERMLALVVTPHLSETMAHFWRKAVPLHLEPFISNDFISATLTQEKSQSEASAGALKEQASYSKARCPGLLCSESGKPALDTTVDMPSEGWPGRVRERRRDLSRIGCEQASLQVQGEARFQESTGCRVTPAGRRDSAGAVRTPKWRPGPPESHITLEGRRKGLRLQSSTELGANNSMKLQRS